MDNSVFVSYRRQVSWSTARLVHDSLRRRRFSVFMDLKNLDTGTFDTIILNEIASRAYFLVVLQPDSLNRCNEPKDWLRREIEYATDLERRIIPLMAYGFKFEDVLPLLSGKLAKLSRFNGINLSAEHFDSAMDRLSRDFLKPVPMPTAQDYYDRAQQLPKDEFEGRIANYDEAIRLNLEVSRLPAVHNNRGVCYARKGDFASAVVDYNESIRLNPNLPIVYANRAFARQEQGNLDGAIEDLEKALDLDPYHDEAANMRERLNEWLDLRISRDIPF